MLNFYLFFMFLLLFYVLLKFYIDQLNELFFEDCTERKGRGNLSWDKNTTEFRGGKKEVGETSPKFRLLFKKALTP